MADLKDKQIRLVGSQNFAYATGSNYTQGHVHFTTDEHGSIVVNGKVYGTTDAAYVYVGSENIPTFVTNAINALDGKMSGNGCFTAYIKQENGIVTGYNSTLENLVTVDNSEAKAYAPKGTNENVKFIKSFEIEGDTIIPKYDYFANNLPDVPNVTVSDTNYSGCYLPEFSASGHEITVTNGTQVVSYNEFSEHLEEVKEMHELVDRFFSGADLDTETVKSYIDTLSEIQEAFKNSYAEGIANSIKDIKISHSGDNSSAYINLTYTTHGGAEKTVQATVTYASATTYGLVKYDNYTIVKNSNNQLSLSIIHDTNIKHSGESTHADIAINVGTTNGYHRQVIIPVIEHNKYGLITESYNAYLKLGYASGTEMGLVKYDNSTIKMRSTGQLYVDGKLTDTKYSMDATGGSTAAQITLIGEDNTRDNIAFRGTGIATVSYNSTNKAIEINVPETVVNYNHHSSNGHDAGAVVAYIDGRTDYRVITNVSLSSDGKLTYSYAKFGHGVNEASFVDVTYGSNVSTTYTAVPGASMELKVPSIKVNKCGHVVDLKENTVRVNFSHDHDEFVWL